MGPFSVPKKGLIRMADSVEIGVAYLSLVASTRGMKPSIKAAMRELDVETGKATQKTGNKLLAGVGGAIGKTAKVGALGIAGLGAAVVGLAAKGGINRALAIEDARASLSGLGHDTKSIDQIMGDALKSVKGTAFGLGDAASVAAAAVASGVKPGRDLERTLKLMGDAATIGGSSLGEMGAILNKASASGKVQGDILAQLGDQGIPIVSLLGKEMKLSAAEVYKAGEDGAISFDHLRNAIESGMGGAALASGKTFRGAWANTMAALGRGGETVIKPVLDLLRDGFNKAIPIIDSVTNSLKPFMAQFTANAPAVIAEIKAGFEAFWTVMSTQVIPALRDAVEWFKQNRQWLEPLTVAVVAGWAAWVLYNGVTGAYTSIGKRITDILKGQTVAQWALNTAMKANVIGLIIAGVIALVAGFIYLWKTNEGFRNFFIGAWNGIKAVIGAVGGFIGGVFSAIGGWITGTLGPVFSWFWNGVIKPVWAAITGAIGSAGAFISGVFQKVVGFISGVLGPIFTWLYERIIKPIWGLIQWYISFVSNVLLFVFDLIVWTLKNVIGPAFKWLYENVIKPVWDSIKSAISTAWTIIKAVFTLLISFIKTTLGNAFTWLYNSIIKPVWDGIKWAIERSWNNFKATFNAIRNFLRDTLGPVFTWLRDNVIKPVWDGIKRTISNVWNNGIKPVFKALGDFIGDKVVPAFRSAVEKIGEIWEGIKKAAGTPVYFVMETIYNQGIKKAFDAVAENIGSDARLPAMDTSGIPHFAKGGLARKGWAVVGEEGPELVNFTDPGRVYTAAETQAMLAGRAQAPTDSLSALSGASPGEARLANGGFWSDTWGGIAGGVKGVFDTGVSWIRGGLAKAAELVLNPVKQLMSDKLGSGGFSGLYSGAISSAIDKVIGWVRGKDKEFPAEDAGGGFAGSYDGARGRFFRPSAGPFTSMFGPRWGAFHAGVDIAGGGKTFAALNGLVKFVGAGGGLPGRTGHGIRLDHGGGFETYYGHNPYGGVQVRPGQQVKAGQHIGYQGATGNVTGTHLHFETLQNGRPLNPMSYLHDSGGWHAPGTMSYNGLKEPEAILTPSQWDTAAKALDGQGGIYRADLDGFLTRLEDLANRPISVKVDSKEIAKATTAGRKELRLPPISPRG